VASEIVGRLQRSMPVSAVVLFGSRARQEHTQHSDHDIAVVSPSFVGEPRMYRRAESLYEALAGVRKLDLVGLTVEELEALDCLLVLDVVSEGVVLFDDGCFARARRLLEERLARGAVQQLPGGWRILAS
jgi:predicted nucleotidyltransferase